MKVQCSLIVLALSVFAVGASAQKLDLKPGLWEVKHKMAAAGGQMEAAAAQMKQQFEGMPPEQRKMMEEMLARQGVSMSGGGVEMNVKMCMTPEMIEKKEIPVQEGNCKTTTKSLSGNVMKMSFSCTDPPSSGEGQFTIVSPEAYTTKMAVRSTVQGKPETMNMDMTGRWLAADCGKVRPPGH